MTDVLTQLYEIIKERKTTPSEGSYTCYLFEKGMDKILKKLGEECTETVIAAKNRDNTETVNEICDLIYHLLVMMAEANIPLEKVTDTLEKRRQKIGNLKQMRETDKET